ncbi:hypothetical protein ES703_34626 [subsurface metagenome]
MKSWVCRHAEGLAFWGYMSLFTVWVLFEKGLLP